MARISLIAFLSFTEQNGEYYNMISSKTGFDLIKFDLQEVISDSTFSDGNCNNNIGCVIVYN